MKILTKGNLYTAYALRLIQQKRTYYRSVKIFSEQLVDTAKYNPRSETPVIIIGMHRSGTTLMTQLLEDLGIFMGRKQGVSTSEDLYFQRLNELLLTLSNATWDNPGSVSSVLKNNDWKVALTKVIDLELERFNFSNYNDVNKPYSWGFKDPRNTYTLPVWLNIFPDAKVINIIRNGESVTSSLVNRAKKNLKESKALSLVSLSSSLSLDLWTDYVMTAHDNCSKLSEKQYLELKYEDLLESPEETIRQILIFLEIDVDQETSYNAVSRVKHPNNPVIKVQKISYKSRKALDFFGYRD